MKRSKRGGYRPNSGRPTKYGLKLGKPTTIRLPLPDLEFLRQISKNISTAIHLLIERTNQNDSQS